MDTRILVVIDFQNDFITGSLGTKEAQAIVPNVINKIKEYKQNYDFIIVTQDTHDSRYSVTKEGTKLPVPHCIYKTEGWNLHPEVEEALANYPHLTIFKGTFGTSKIAEHIKHAKLDKINIEIIGLCTDVCVVTNAILLKTAFPEADISIDASCCAGVTPELHSAALKVMKSCQIDVTGE